MGAQNRHSGLRLNHTFPFDIHLLLDPARQRR
jgi:hypothetical protein